MGSEGRPDNHVFYRTFFADHPLIEKGEGAYIYDAQGKRYLQGSSGPTLINIGHGVVEIVEVMANQARKLAFIQLPLRSEPLMRMAKRVTEMAPKGLNKVFFTPGGSEANETAIQLARHYHLGKGNTQRYKFVGRWQCHHGATLGCISLSGRPSSRRSFQPLLLDFPHIVPPNCYRCPLGKTYPGCGAACADELERIVLRSGPDTISGFITEAINGPSIAGLTPPPEYYPRIREICDKYDLLFVVDEVMSGFGRTGANFAIDHWRVVPDMITFGKGVAGGYFSLGGVIIADKVVDVFIESKQRMGTSYSHIGDPLAMAIGDTVLEMIQTKGLVENAKVQGEYLLKRLGDLANHHRSIGIVRGRGLLLGVEFVKDRETKEPFPAAISFSRRLARYMWHKGVSIRADSLCIDGVAGDEIRIAPPLIISQVEADEIIAALDESLTEVE